MSLDVYLISKEPQKRPASSDIFVRQEGQTKEISAEEWNALYPDSDPVIFESTEEETNEIFSANITHNLNKMADAAGIYMCLWRPDEIEITKASQLIEPLRNGLHTLISDPERFMEYIQKTDGVHMMDL